MSTFLVAGAGMIGVSTALALQECGHEVTIVDRRAPGQETSYGNAGLIQREAIEPYAFPTDPSMLIDVLLGRNAAVGAHAAYLLRSLPRVLSYLRHSLGNRYRGISESYRLLIDHCIEDHEVWIDAAGGGDLIGRRGYLAIYRTPVAFDRAARAASQKQAHCGVSSHALDEKQTKVLEPGLEGKFSGAIHYLQPWSCSDPGELVRRYAELFRRRGGAIVCDELRRIEPTGRGWNVQAGTSRLTAENLVVALGPWSSEFLSQLGYRIPMLLKRGYHQHYRPKNALAMTVLDAERGYALAPMRQGLRLTTGAELAGLAAQPTPGQLVKAERFMSELIGHTTPSSGEPWHGTRPCIVDMLPVVGPAPRHQGLWFNFGHGHQGFTLGPTCGRLVAQLAGGGRGEVPAAPFAPSRFRRL